MLSFLSADTTSFELIQLVPPGMLFNDAIWACYIPAVSSHYTAKTRSLTWFVCVSVCLYMVSEGEILAKMEESSRDFLYPGPRLSSRGATEREILMKRSSSFPVGCFPFHFSLTPPSSIRYNTCQSRLQRYLSYWQSKVKWHTIEFVKGGRGVLVTRCI